MTDKLYKVTLRGMTCGPGQIYGVSYVVAKNPDQAYKKVRASLNKKDMGFRDQRELLSVELIAECDEYPECKTILYI